MPTVLPSQIVQYVDKTFTTSEIDGSMAIRLDPSRCGALNALVKLVDQIHNVLLPSDPDQYSQLVRSVEEIRFSVSQAESQNKLSMGQTGYFELRPSSPKKPNPVGIIRRAFELCPDEVTPHQSADIAFVKDVEIRYGLLRDLMSTRSALLHEEWKAATVIAGSLVEALLLWGIKQSAKVDISKACQSSLAKSKLSKHPTSDALNWNLFEYIEVALELGLIEENTAVQARLAKDFRNLIHPGRALKKQQVCDRGTALAANAAAELVVRDFQFRFP